MTHRLNRPTICAPLAAACLFATTFAPTATAPAQDRPAPMDPSFTVLLERSMFSKDGRSRTAAPPPSTAPAAPPVRVLSPEQSNVFRGVLCPDEEYVAFIQNVQTDQVSVLKAGDEIAGGRIVAITLDTLNYASGGKVLEIRLGQNLAGETAAAGTTASTSTTAAATGTSTGATASTPSSPSDPALQSAAERMRQRRLQEGGR